MMGERSTNPMVALPRHRRPSLQLLAAALALGIQGLPLRAQAQGAVAYPSPETLRDVQLAALACARENTSATCSQARKLADPLMDHPRLPGGCKDALWAIIQTSTPASSNKKGRGGDSVIGVKSCMSSLCLIDLSTSFNLTCHRYSSLEPCPFVLSLFLLCLFLTMSCTFLFS